MHEKLIEALEDVRSTIKGKINNLKSGYYKDITDSKEEELRLISSELDELGDEITQIDDDFLLKWSSN